MTTTKAKSPAQKDAPPAARSEAARLMGRARTEAKITSSLRNLDARPEDKKGGRPQKPLAEIPCRCEAGAALTGHRWDCPRGQAVKRRQKAGKL